MINVECKQCKSKECNNPVIEGKYCEYCKKRRKENKDKALATGFGLLVMVLTIKNQGPKIASKAVKILKK